MKKTKKTPALVGEDIGACPFCDDGKLSVSRQPPAVMHSMPPCQVFVLKDTNDFLAAVRRERAKAPLL